MPAGSARMPPPTMVLKSEIVAALSVMAPPPRCTTWVLGALSLDRGAVMASLVTARSSSSEGFIMISCNDAAVALTAVPAMRTAARFNVNEKPVRKTRERALRAKSLG